MSEIKTWYLVQTLRMWSSLTVLGLPLNGEKDARGCAGFLPVFDSYEAAHIWRMEHGHENAGIVAMQALSESVEVEG